MIGRRVAAVRSGTICINTQLQGTGMCLQAQKPKHHCGDVSHDHPTTITTCVEQEVYVLHLRWAYDGTKSHLFGRQHLYHLTVLVWPTA